MKRLLLALGATVGAFLVAAIGVTILDLYISGQGGRTLGSRTLIDAPWAKLSFADGAAMGLALAAGLVVALYPRGAKSGRGGAA